MESTKAIYPVTDRHTRVYLDGYEVYAEYESEIDDKYLKIIVFDHSEVSDPLEDELVLTLDPLPKTVNYRILRRSPGRVTALHKGKANLIYDHSGPDEGMSTFIFKLSK